VTHEHIRELFTQGKRGLNAQLYRKKIRKQGEFLLGREVCCPQSTLERNLTILDCTTARVRQRQARTSEEKSGAQVRQCRYLKPGSAPASGREEKWLT
jgi:hypothetical protein